MRVFLFLNPEHALVIRVDAFVLHECMQLMGYRHRLPLRMRAQGFPLTKTFSAFLSSIASANSFPQPRVFSFENIDLAHFRYRYPTELRTRQLSMPTGQLTLPKD